MNFLLLDREPPESSMAEMKQILRAKKEMLRSAAKSYDSAKTLFNKFSESDETGQIALIEKYDLNRRMSGQIWASIQIEDQTNSTNSPTEGLQITPFNWQAECANLKGQLQDLQLKNNMLEEENKKIKDHVFQKATSENDSHAWRDHYLLAALEGSPPFWVVGS